jgi:hypothetical protein
MTRRLPTLLVVAATAAILVACNGAPTGPALTDPKAIVAAALTATQSAKSVHLDITVDGTASVALPIGGATGTPIDLTGTTATADIDFARPAAHATFAAPSLLGLAGELIALDTKVYLKTTLTGPLYQVSSASAAPIDPTKAQGMLGGLGDLLAKPGVNLAKAPDVACGTKSCYAVTADLTAAELGTTGSGIIGSLPVDLAGATLKLTLRVEKDLPYHLAGATAVITMPGGAVVTMDLTASKWDLPVTVTAPAADKVKPASS